MHISNTQINKVMELHLHKVYAAQPMAATNGTARVDRLTISRQATEMQQIRQAISALPDTRGDVVSDIRQRISTGNYEIDDQKLARSMFARAMDGRVSN